MLASLSRVVAVALLALACSCAPGAHCRGGSCTCDPGASCDFGCNRGPCDVNCTGDNPSCVGGCSNGDCVCGQNSSCTFSCTTAPCRVHCAAGSTCHVVCSSAPCTTECEAGAHCTQECGVTNVGTVACDITPCGAGTRMICPDGFTATCGATCPSS